LGGGVSRGGEEDDIVDGGWLTCEARVAAAAGEVRAACGRERHAGWLRGLRALAGQRGREGELGQPLGARGV